MAPARPIADAIANKKLNTTPSKLEQRVREAYQEDMRYEEASWNEMISAGQLVSLFIGGDFLLQRRPFGPGYYVRPLAPDDTYRQTAMNMMRFYYQCCETKMISANPTVTIRPGGDDPLDIATAQAARPVVDYWESQFYTGKFSRRECMYAATNGMFIHRVRWNPFKGAYMAQSRTVNQQSVQLDDGFGECAECGHQGPATEFPETQFGDQCPNCQSGAVDVKRPKPFQFGQVSMGATQPLGEPEILQTPLAAWRWPLQYELEEAPWAIYRQRITNGAISLMLGDLALPDTASSDDKGLDVIHALAYGGQPVGGSTVTANRRETDKRPTMAEYWVSPERYADWDIDEGETVSGIRLPKGKMRDFFHDPMCFVGLNDMSLLIGTYAKESQCNEVVTGQWFIKSDSGAGRGMQDSARVQKRINAVDGHVYQGLAGTATPAVVTDLRLMKEEQSGYLFKPNTTIDINLSMLPPGLGLKDAFYMGTPGNVNQQYIEYGRGYLKDMMQVSSMVTEFSDFMSIDNRTATGAQITAALANSLFGPMLLVKGEARVRIAKIVVELEAKYGSVSRYFPGKGAARGRSVSGKNLQGKVIYELTENSHLPVSPFSQQTDVRAMFEAYGGAAVAQQIKQADPAFFRATSKPFPIDWGADNEEDISTICLERIEQMEDLMRMGVTDPQELVNSIKPVIRKAEPKHKEKAEWMSGWLDLDTSREKPEVLRQAVENLYWKHLNLETQKSLPAAVNTGLVQGANIAATQAPSALGQAGLQQLMGGGGDPQAAAQMQHEKEQQAQDQEMEATQHVSDQQHEMRTKAMEIEGQKQITMLQGQNAAESARIAGDNAVRVQKAKPHPKPATAAA